MARSKKPKGRGRKPKQNKKTRHEVIDDQRHHRITNNQKYLQPIVIIDIEVTVMEMEEIREVMEQRLHHFLVEDQAESWWSGVGTGFPSMEFGMNIHQPKGDLERLDQGVEDVAEARGQAWAEDDLRRALQLTDKEEAAHKATRSERKRQEHEQAEEARRR